MERDWIIPATVFTTTLLVVDFVLLPLRASIDLFVFVYPLWLLIGLMVGGLAVIWHVLRMMLSGERAPTRRLVRDLRLRPAMVVGFVLAGVNMVAFMGLKPVLNQLVPFTADVMLDRLDQLLLLGHRGSDLFAFLNADGMAYFYHRGWFLLIVAALLFLLTQPPDQRRSALLITYFLLWTMAGPIVHLLIPAGGPIFFERLTGLTYPLSISLPTAELADTLWRHYRAGTVGPGAGISAMPSLHIATVAWACLVFWPTSWRWGVLAASVLIFLLSMSLGWHYALDGIVGAGLALLFYRAGERWLVQPGFGARRMFSEVG